MKFSVSSLTLTNRLAALGRVISTKNNNIPILGAILFEIKGNDLHLTGSDGETTLVTSIELISSEGDCRFAISAKTIQDALKEIPEQPLTFDLNADTLEIDVLYQNGKYHLIGQNADEYPIFQRLDNNANSFTIPSNLLLSSLTRALFAAMDDDMHPVMNGVYFDMVPHGITIVATDGRIMVCTKSPLANQDKTANFILHKKPSTLLKSLLGKEENDIVIRFNERNASVEMEDYRMDCRLIEGRYPNYNSVIPTDNPNHVTINRATMLSALRRIMVFSDPTTALVKIQLSPNEIALSSQAIDFSQSAEENVVCDYAGASMSIGFKGTYLIDILNNLTGNDVIIKLGDPSRAGVIVPAEQDENQNILMLIMPLMLNE